MEISEQNSVSGHEPMESAVAWAFLEYPNISETTKELIFQSSLKDADPVAYITKFMRKMDESGTKIVAISVLHEICVQCHHHLHSSPEKLNKPELLQQFAAKLPLILSQLRFNELSVVDKVWESKDIFQKSILETPELSKFRKIIPNSISLDLEVIESADMIEAVILKGCNPLDSTGKQQTPKDPRKRMISNTDSPDPSTSNNTSNSAPEKYIEKLAAAYRNTVQNSSDSSNVIDTTFTISLNKSDPIPDNDKIKTIKKTERAITTEKLKADRSGESKHPVLTEDLTINKVCIHDLMVKIGTPFAHQCKNGNKCSFLHVVMPRLLNRKLKTALKLFFKTQREIKSGRMIDAASNIIEFWSEYEKSPRDRVIRTENESEVIHSNNQDQRDIARSHSKEGIVGLNKALAAELSTKRASSVEGYTSSKRVRSQSPESHRDQSDIPTTDNINNSNSVTHHSSSRTVQISNADPCLCLHHLEKSVCFFALTANMLGYSKAAIPCSRKFCPKPHYSFPKTVSKRMKHLIHSKVKETTLTRIPEIHKVLLNWPETSSLREECNDHNTDNTSLHYYNTSSNISSSQSPNNSSSSSILTIKNINDSQNSSLTESTSIVATIVNDSSDWCSSHLHSALLNSRPCKYGAQCKNLHITLPPVFQDSFKEKLIKFIDNVRYTEASKIDMRAAVKSWGKNNDTFSTRDTNTSNNTGTDMNIATNIELSKQPSSSNTEKLLSTTISSQQTANQSPSKDLITSSTNLNFSPSYSSAIKPSPSSQPTTQISNSNTTDNDINTLASLNARKLISNAIPTHHAIIPLTDHNHNFPSSGTSITIPSPSTGLTEQTSVRNNNHDDVHHDNSNNNTNHHHNDNGNHSHNLVHIAGPLLTVDTISSMCLNHLKHLLLQSKPCGNGDDCMFLHFSLPKEELNWKLQSELQVYVMKSVHKEEIARKMVKAIVLWK